MDWDGLRRDGTLTDWIFVQEIAVGTSCPVTSQLPLAWTDEKPSCIAFRDACACLERSAVEAQF